MEWSTILGLVLGILGAYGTLERIAQWLVRKSKLWRYRGHPHHPTA